MGLLESAILSICMSSSGQARLACSDAMQAGAKQTGFEQMTESYERRETMYYESGTYNFMGQQNAEIAGGTVLVANAVATRKARVGLPTLGLCDNLSVETNGKESKFIFKWFF
jgi:hypothetical protein